jgi:hypothetical protein
VIICQKAYKKERKFLETVDNNGGEEGRVKRFVVP